METKKSIRQIIRKQRKELDPYDVWRLTGGLGVSLQQLLAGHLELNVGGRDHSAKSETGG